MRYKEIHEGIFIERPNRFIAHVLVDGKEEIAHVKNTGRCKELLVPKALVYLEKSDNPKRKTKWSLISVKKRDRLINIDSQAPNKVVEEAINSGIIKLTGISEDNFLLRREKNFGSSRFDFYFESDDRKGFIEVKGVTLEADGVVRFPDAPTQRGTKHLTELTEAVKEGYLSYIIFVVQMKDVKYFEPNYKTDPLFGNTLKKANASGVNIMAFDCIVDEDSMYVADEVKVKI
jgi:sugar fermentation stimulation protein A